eukprot:s5101_g3.t1
MWDSRTTMARSSWTEEERGGDDLRRRGGRRSENAVRGGDELPEGRLSKGDVLGGSGERQDEVWDPQAGSDQSWDLEVHFESFQSEDQDWDQVWIGGTWSGRTECDDEKVNEGDGEEVSGFEEQISWPRHTLVVLEIVEKVQKEWSGGHEAVVDVKEGRHGPKFVVDLE